MIFNNFKFPKNNQVVVAAIFLLANHLLIGVDAHGYLKSPRSRNYQASINPIWSGGTLTDPAPENCPHCLNSGGTVARCGKVGDHNYDYPPNAIGGVLPPVTQACYEEGAIIDIESALTAHHKGHFEVKACAISSGEVATQECFNANPLSFVEDKLYGAPVDPLYPGRAYIPRTDFAGLTRGPNGEYPFHHFFKLPNGLRGDLVLLQWYYLTANSCVTEGYNTYSWPEGFYPGDLPVCQSIPPDGRGVPEQFWNCAEVAIKVGNGCGGMSSPPPVSAGLPTSLPTALPTSVSNPPVTSSTTSSTLATTTTTTTTNASNSNCASQTATCGRDKPCADGMCCSQWGYCGTGDAYCGLCCQNGNCLNPLVSQKPTTMPTSAQQQSTPNPTNALPSTTTTTTSTATSATAMTTTSSSGAFVLNSTPRCGKSEIDARELCKPICATDSDCGTGEFCWSVHSNYCGSIPQRVYDAPVQSSVNSRCGVFEEMARTFCGEPCSWQCSKPGESCISVHANYCGSTFTEVGAPTTTTVATTSATTTNAAPTPNPTLKPTSQKPTSSKPTLAGQTSTPTSKSPTQKPSTMKPATRSPTSKPTAQSPTLNPTTSKPSTQSPTQLPSSAKPTTLFPSSSPVNLPPMSSAAAAVEAVLDASKADIDNKILLSQEPSMQWVPSTIYRYADLLDGLRVMYNDGVANKYFFIGDNSPNGHIYGLVNIAAFLAQSMKETIQYNACDENSWDLVNGKYPVANACGQLGQSYQDYKCSESEAHMECEVKADMEITATTNAKWWGAPAPLYCGPKSKYPFTGIWDYTKECNLPWNNPPEYCDDYPGQKAGGFDNSSPFPNSSGRTDVEGCCFWGRGVIQTTGVCNFGKLNYFLGKRAFDEGRGSRYPNINFCETPDAICASQEHKELKWIAGMFYWVESLQSYNVGGWDYITELKKYVDGGMIGNSFIDAVSGIVNRGCHNPPCMTGEVDGREDRSANFHKVLTVFDL